ncbi:MAG: tRNA (guanosine(46)-N7)-methyltransferase TrmB [Muribaculaceae bacterium]|nr:tRNA (guanosine(46)-N7)-methyltransferase TrmB [Muribaculaceae bacterium]
MGKNKLKKFAEMETFSCVFQYPFGKLKESPFPMKGKWKDQYFHNNNPIVLELGCGKGEYAVGLGKKIPTKNYIGIDIKGARMWTGAKIVEQESIKNVAFLRTSIELIEHFFEPGEVDEIWITFPDPQMKNANKRLTGTRFLKNYRKVLVPDGIIHLKTDSPFLYTYTHELTKLNNLDTDFDTSNLYNSGFANDILEIKTHYEMQWLQRGLTIKYISFHLPQEGELLEPDIDIEHDTYRSYGRGEIQMPQIFENNNTQK